jgi:putative tryptophan/tyrosine transport system substrate-binding protein
MRRREFITLLGGAMAAWPLTARSQQRSGSMPQVGVLMTGAETDPEERTRLTAFLDGLRQLGWSDGHNLRIDIRWAVDVDRNRRAEELVALTPNVIVAAQSASVAALQRITRNVPIVFANVVDPVGAGFVAGLARPGGNTTGFSAFEYSLSGKWLELLKQLAPSMTRAAVLRDPALAAGIGQFAAIQALAPPSIAVELTPINAHDPEEIERGIIAFARERNGGLIVTASQSALEYRNLIISLASRHLLPNVYPFRYYPANGGLASYGPDPIAPFKRASEYVDRILKGEKAADLPVQAPTEYKLVINLKTAKALGLTVPPALLAGADEVIE